MRPEINAVVFDLGGVLADWNPRHLYRKIIPDPVEMERFLADVCSPEWNERQDAGRPLALATAEKVAEFPQFEDWIRAYYGRWPEMLAGAVEGCVAILEELAAREVPLYALSNWSAELFPHARDRFPFLGLFRGMVISGEEGVVKPEPEIFRRLWSRYGLRPERCVFIDDIAGNVAASRRLGMPAIRFESPEQLRRDLAGLGLDAMTAATGKP